MSKSPPSPVRKGALAGEPKPAARVAGRSVAKNAGVVEPTAAWMVPALSMAAQPSDSAAGSSFALGWRLAWKLPRRYLIALSLLLAVCTVETAILTFARPGALPKEVDAPPALSGGVESVASPHPGCVRSSTQTLPSRERDQLLYDAVASYDTGKLAQALGLLHRYVDEACDDATLEAVLILERRGERAAKER